MRLLLFSGRVAFIFNLFFIACLVFRYNDIVTAQSVKGFVIVMGWLIAPIVNFIFVSAFIIGRLVRNFSSGIISAWLFTFNFVLLAAQIVIMLFV